jgi:hypothetical protein
MSTDKHALGNKPTAPSNNIDQVGAHITGTGMSYANAPFMRSPYNYDTKAASDQAATDHFGPSLTIQSHAEDADLNVILKRFGVTGTMPVNPKLPSYGDFSEITDFQSALAAVEHAQELFMEYPADLRAKFENSPQRLLEFVSDPKNLPAMRELGLAKPLPATPPGNPPQATAPEGKPRAT